MTTDNYIDAIIQMVNKPKLIRINCDKKGCSINIITPEMNGEPLKLHKQVNAESLFWAAKEMYELLKSES